MQRAATGPKREGAGKGRLTKATVAGAIAAAVGGMWLARADFAQSRPARVQAAPTTRDDTPPGEATVAPKRPQAADTGGMMDRAADSGGQIYVDDSFASVEQLRTAQRYAGQGQSQLAIQTYQGIIDKYGQKLVYLNNNSYVSITDYVRGKLLSMPSVRNGMYDQLYGQDAAKAIDAAVTDADLATLVRVCDRYFPSTAAFSGLMKAGDWCFERGEFAGASRIWQQLLEHPAAGDHQAELLFRAALAEHLGRNDAAAKPLGERLTKDFADATGKVGGESDVNLATKLAELLKTPPFEAQQAVADEWPAFDGGPSRSLTPPVDATAGARLWGISLEDPTIQGDRNQPGLRAMGRGGAVMINANGQAQQGPVGPALTSFPTLSNGTIFVNTGERVVALSSSAGTLLWAYPQQVISRLSPQQEQVLRSNNAAGHPAAHDSATIYGDEVYAVLPASPVPGQPMVMDYPYSMTGPTRVVALSRQTGKERWSTSAQTIKPDGDKPAATPPTPQPGRAIRLGVDSGMQQNAQLSFIGSPIVTRQGVFVMATKSGDPSFVPYYLVRLDRDSGDVSWACYLCSVSTGAYYFGYSSLASIPIPTLVDDIVYIATGQGADCAVDANVGRILWLQVTDSAKNTKNPADYYVQREGTAAWKFNPPMVYGNKLISYESSGAATPGASGGWLRVYDRWSGQLLTTATRADLHVGAADIVAGISGNKLILTGQNVSAIDLDTIEKDPKAVWTVTYPPVSEAGKPSGRTFLAEKILYVPFEKGLLTVDVQAGKKMDFWPWPKDDKDVPGKGGNLLVTTEQVVVVNDQEIAGYSRWETARDNRLKGIAANPQSPDPYLALAEISFRTSHFDLAQQNMVQAVDLANRAAGNGGSNSAGAETLDRLYRTNLNFAEQLLGKTEGELKARSRFYFEQCKATARGAEQQAEWRLDLSDLSIEENKPEEAANLFNDVLTDAALREAPFRQGDAMARAGVMAETRFRTLIDKNGAAVYKPFEQQAAADLAKAGNDPAALQRVVDQYPNSVAAATAAARTAAAQADKGDFEGQRKALAWLYPRVSGDEKAKVTAELAEANLHLKRFATADGWAQRGLRQFKGYTWTAPAAANGGGAMTFETLLSQVKAARPAAAEGRLPMLPPPTKDADGRPVGSPDMDEASVAEPVKDASGKAIATDGTFALGTLLAPIETAPMYSRPDMLFVYSAQSVKVYDTSSGVPTQKGEAVRLAGTGPSAALVGCYGDVAVVAQNQAITGIDLQTMKQAWKVTFNFSVRDSMARNAAQLPPGAQQAVINGRIVIINGGIVESDGMTIGNAVDLTGDPEAARRNALQSLSAPAYSTLRMIGDKLMVVSGGKVHAYSLKTGAPAWTDEKGAEVLPAIPDNSSAAALIGNDDLLAVELDRTDKPGASFLVIDADTGKVRRQLTLPAEERVYWRGLSSDGMLFVVSDQAVSGYDLINDSDKPAWRRSDLQSRYPAATQVTLDGLIFVNSYNQLMCLSSEGGEVRWPSPANPPLSLNIPAGQLSSGQYPFLRSVVDGDMVIFESTQGVSAYYTYPRSADDGQLAWEATFTSNTTPPLENMLVSDPYVVVMAEGPMQTAQHAVHIVLMNRKGGKRHLDKVLQRSPNDLEGPQIQTWMVADNGIALSVNGHIYFYHGKTPVKPPEPAAGDAPTTNKAEG